MKSACDTFPLRLASVACMILLSGYLVFPTSVAAQQSITTPGVPVEQNFDSLGASATATLPTGWRVGTDWTAGAVATTLAYGTSGAGVVTSSSSGGIVNWANGVTASSTLRALGFLNTGSFTSPRSIIYAFQNDTGAAVTSLTISWAYEKYRSGTRAWNWTFFHGSTSSPSTSAVGGDQSYAGDVDNATVLNPPASTAKSVTITGLTIPNGSVYYLRWTLTGVGGSSNGQGLGINNFAVTLGASTSPTITAAPSSLPSFLTFIGTPSSSQSFSVSGSNLTADITITAPAGFELSLTSGGSYSGSIALAPSGGTVASTTIFARLTGASIGSPSGNITLTSAGATQQNVAVTGTVTPLPSVLLSTTGPLNLGTVVQGNASPPQTFTVQGSNLAGNLLITPPTGCEISNDSGATWNGSTLIIAPVGGSVPLTTISVRIAASAGPGSVNGNVSVATAGTTTQNVGVTGTVTAASTITPNPTTLAAMTTVVGTPSSPRNFAVTGNDLTGAVTVGAPAGFEISLASGGPYSGSLTLTPSAGIIASTTIFARLIGTSIGSPAGNISLSGGGAAPKTVAVSGTVTPPPPSLTATPASLTGFSTIQGTASAAQPVTVSGTNLTANVIVTAPAKYEVSGNGGTSYATTATLTPTGGTLASTNLLVRVAASAASGAASGTLTVTSTGATTQNVSLSGTVTPPPSMQLIVPSILPAPGQTLGQIVLSSPAIADVVVTLVNNRPAFLQIPSTVTVPLGQKTASFTMTTISVGSDVTARIEATAAGYGLATANTVISATGVQAAPLVLDENGLPEAYVQDFAGFNADRPILPLGWRATIADPPFAGQDVPLSDYSPWSVVLEGVKYSSALVRVFGYQHNPGGAVFSPSLVATQLVTLRNDTGSVITSLRVSYAGRTARSSADPTTPADRKPAYSVTVDGNTVPNLAYSTSEGDNKSKSATIGGLAIQPSQTVVIAWTSNNGAGFLDSKQIGISDVQVEPIVPTIAVTPATADNSFVTTLGTVSNPARTFFVAGGGLTAGVTVTAPTGFEVSTSFLTGYAASVTLPATAGAVDATVYVRLQGTALGAVQGNITFASAGATTVSVPVSGVVFAAGTAAQVLASTTSLAPFTTEVTQRSAFQSFSVSARNIGATPVVLTAPAGFEISLNSGSNYGQNVTVNPSSGAINARSIFVRMTGAAQGSLSGTITITNSLVASIPGVTVNGTVGPPRPTIFVNPTTLPIMVAAPGAPSPSRSFVVSGRDLTGDVVIRPPNGFQISRTTNNLDFSDAPVLLTPAANGALTNTTNYVRLSGAVPGEFSDFIELTSQNAERKLVEVTGTVASAPVITAYPPSVTFADTYVGKGSDPENVEVTGQLLVAVNGTSQGIIATTTTGFQVLSTNTTSIPANTWTNSLTLIASSAATLQETLQVRVATNAPAASPLTGELALSSGPTITTVQFNVLVCPQPSVAVNPTSLSGFDTVLGRPSPAQTFIVSGADLQDALVLTASAGYEISTNNSTWSSSLTLARQFPSGGGGAPTITAQDNAGNYGGGWASGSNGGTGFAAWTISANQGTGFAGNFIGDPNFAGVTGMGTQAFGLYANPVGSGAFVDVRRDFGTPLADGETFSFQWGLNWDSGGGNKGFNIFVGGTQVVNVNMGGFPGDITFNGANTGITFGTQPMTWSATFTAPGNLEVTSTGRDGAGGVLFRTNIATPAAPTGFAFYTSAMEAGDRRQAYFNTLRVGSGGDGCDDAFVPDTTIYVRLTGGAPAGARAGSVTANSLGATPRTVTLNGVVWTISGTPGELTFYSVLGYDSDPQLLTIGGANRPTAVRVTPPAGFIVRDPSNGNRADGSLGQVLTLTGNTVEVFVSSTAPLGAINSQLLLGSGSWSDAGTVQLRGRVGYPADNDIFISTMIERLMFRIPDPNSTEMADYLALLSGGATGQGTTAQKASVVMQMMGFDAVTSSPNYQTFDWEIDYLQILDVGDFSGNYVLTSVAFAPYARLGLLPSEAEIRQFVATVADNPTSTTLDIIPPPPLDAVYWDPYPVPNPAIYNGVPGDPWGATQGMAQAMTDFFNSATFQANEALRSKLLLNPQLFVNWLANDWYFGVGTGSAGSSQALISLTEAAAPVGGQGAAAAFRSMYARALCRLNPTSNPVTGVIDIVTEKTTNEGEKTFQLRLNLAALDYQLWRNWSYTSGPDKLSSAYAYGPATVQTLLRGPVIAAGTSINGTANSAITPYKIPINQPTAPINLRTYFRVASGSLPTGVTLSPSGTLSGTPATSGVYNFTVIAQNLAGDSAPRSFTLNVAVSATSQARKWMSDFGYGSASMSSKASDDSDSDRLRLTVEYAFGGNPLVQDGPLVNSAAVGVSTMRLEWLALQLGASYTIEGSADMQTWSDVTGITINDLGASGIYRRREALLPISGERRFFRVKSIFDAGSLD